MVGYNCHVGGGSFLLPFFQELNAQNVRYCVLRNYDLLPQSTGGSDIDMWVHPDDVVGCTKVLVYASLKSQSVLVTTYGDETSLKVGYLNKTDGIQIDIFNGAIYYKNLILSNEIAVSNHTILHNGVRVMDDAYADLLAFLKELLNNGRVKEKYLLPLYKKNIYTKEYINQALTNFSTSFCAHLSSAIQTQSIEKVSNELQREAIAGLCKKNSVSYFKQKWAQFRRVLGPAPGNVIVVEGTDGSGKSFIIDSITPILNGAFHNGIVYNHLRPNLLPDIAVLMGKRKKKKEEDKIVASDPHNGKQSGLAGSLVRWGYYMIDYTFGYMKKVWLPIHSKSKVFIFDRYYYEFYLDQKRSHVKLPNWIVRLGEMLIPKPDLILCLGGDPEKIYARKPETSLEEVKRQTQVLKDFCNKRKNAVWIDTTVEPQESIDAAMEAILDVMGKRFSVEDLR